MLKKIVCIILMVTPAVCFGYDRPVSRYQYHSGSMSRGYTRYNPAYISPMPNYVRPNGFGGHDYFSNGKMYSRSIGVNRGQYFIFRR